MNKIIFFILCLGVNMPVFANAGDPPQTFLIKPAALLHAKEKIKQHDPAMQQALTELLAVADKTLQQEVYSVVFKSKVPPSGDKHDYMSVGPYWWPDSSKPNGLPYIRKDGEVNPERFTIKDATYHNAICNNAQVLGLAWFYTGDTKYVTQATKLLRAWFLDPATRMNPNLNYGQAIPGRTDGRGIGLIDTRALTSLIDGVQLLKGAPGFTAADYKGIQDWYKAFLHWMRTSPVGMDEADQRNNHGTWYDVQTVAIALFTGQKELAAKMLKEQTEQRIESQLKPDGSQPLELARTLSWNYSGMNLKGFFELAMLAENVGIDLWHYETPGKKSLKKAFLFLLPYAAGTQPWQHKQIKPLNNKEYLQLALVAKEKYPDVNLSSLWKGEAPKGNYLWELTNWIF
ncbi:alginate lyase family protein [Chitinophaga sp. MM2321]|uniref:alginate lyase family protein n=1 Tax=Chitinophaga sp. MM2321 TaxID=3137178 RepID=UPI0032D57007